MFGYPDETLALVLEIVLDKTCKEATGSFEAKQTNMVDIVDKTQETLYRIDCSLDETQQYLRRDCLEITGVPITSHDNPKLLVKVAQNSFQHLYLDASLQPLFIT